MRRVAAAATMLSGQAKARVSADTSPPRPWCAPSPSSRRSLLELPSHMSPRRVRSVSVDAAALVPSSANCDIHCFESRRCAHRAATSGQAEMGRPSPSSSTDGQAALSLWVGAMDDDGSNGARRRRCASDDPTSTAAAAFAMRLVHRRRMAAMASPPSSILGPHTAAVVAPPSMLTTDVLGDVVSPSPLAAPRHVPSDDR